MSAINFFQSSDDSDGNSDVEITAVTDHRSQEAKDSKINALSITASQEAKTLTDSKYDAFSTELDREEKLLEKEAAPNQVIVIDESSDSAPDDEDSHPMMDALAERAAAHIAEGSDAISEDLVAGEDTAMEENDGEREVVMEENGCEREAVMEESVSDKEIATKVSKEKSMNKNAKTEEIKVKKEDDESQKEDDSVKETLVALENSADLDDEVSCLMEEGTIDEGDEDIAENDKISDVAEEPFEDESDSEEDNDEFDEDLSDESSESSSVLLYVEGDEDENSLDETMELSLIQGLGESFMEDNDYPEFAEDDYGAAAGNRYWMATNASKTCFNCGKRGHTRQECTDPTPCSNCGSRDHLSHRCHTGVCFNCFRPGHQKMDCPREPRPGRPECRRCGLPGHVEGECPDIWRDYVWAQPLAERKALRKFCFNCGAKGHFGEECREQRPIFARKTCSQFLVSAFVDEQDLRLRGYFGRSIRYPVSKSERQRSRSRDLSSRRSSHHTERRERSRDHRKYERDDRLSSTTSQHQNRSSYNENRYPSSSDDHYNNKRARRNDYRTSSDFPRHTSSGGRVAPSAPEGAPQMGMQPGMFMVPVQSMPVPIAPMPAPFAFNYPQHHQQPFVRSQQHQPSYRGGYKRHR